MKYVEPAKRLAVWLGGREPVVLLCCLAIVGAVWTFAVISDEVVEGDTQSLDERIVRTMRQPEDPARPVGPLWLHEMGRDATALGGILALVLFTIAVAGFLWLNRQPQLTWFVLIAIFGGILMSLGLKALFARPRPSVVPHLSIVHTSSFPSGHAMLSAVVYLTLGALLARAFRRRRLKVYILTVAIVLSLVVGVSRVYLGVHYPTDVLAGWMAGLVWALLCWLIARWWLKPSDQVSESLTPDP